MSDLRELYQEVIVDHNRKPRNFKSIEGADYELQGYNPLCGDKVTLFLKFQDDHVTDVGFQGSGCAISTSSASLLTEALKGKNLAQIEDLYGKFHSMVTGDMTDEPSFDELGKLAVLGGVREFPSRVKCATLVWHTLMKALHDKPDVATTE